jgi:hypothetical protein
MSGIITANIGAGSGLVQAPAGVPSGVILMWHGAIANIPTGWVLCNGSNSTPDLRGQFVQGAANGVEAGATGGSATATPAAHSDHSVTQPSNHSVTQPSAHAALATHQHRTSFAKSDNWHRLGVDVYGEYGTGSNITVTSHTDFSSVHASIQSIAGYLTEAIAAGTPDTHSGTAVDAHSSTAVDAHSAHSTSDSRPPFYTILYIMKS